MALQLPALCLVTDRRRCAGRSLEEVVGAAVDGGVGLVQLREKDLPAAQLYALAERLRDITTDRALFFVNDRFDVALAAGADGVHLPENGLPVAAARTVANSRLLIGRSVHTVEGAVQAESDGADLLIAGTVFATTSHAEALPRGPGFLKHLGDRVGIPFLAIGGVTAENIESVISHGASGAAVVTAITESEDPERASRHLVDAMRLAWDSALNRAETLPA